MRFLFVDRITSLGDGRIVGQRHFGADAPMQYGDSRGDRQIAPGVVSEAVGQLVSWLTIRDGGFKARPVFLFADKIEILAPVRPGATVDLTATVDELSEETFVFSGEATVGGQLVHRVSRVNGFFMPLADLEDPEVTRSRFAALTDGGLTLPGDEGIFDFDGLVDQEIERTDDAIIVAKTMSADERFYKDHFPRFPVTPIVMINEMIGGAAARLLSPSDYRALIPRTVEGIKIRNFVKPGETVRTKVTVKKRTPCPGGEEIHTVAEVTKDEKTILRGKYSYALLNR